MKGDPMDLRLDIERRKKYCSHESHCDHDHERDSGNSKACSREKSVEKLSKCHERSKYVKPFMFFCIVQKEQTRCSVARLLRETVSVGHEGFCQCCFSSLPEKVKRSVLDQVLPQPPHHPSPRKRICSLASLIPKIKAFTSRN